MILPNHVYDIRLSHDTVEYKLREGSRRRTIKSKICLQEVLQKWCISLKQKSVCSQFCCQLNGILQKLFYTKQLVRGIKIINPFRSRW